MAKQSRKSKAENAWDRAKVRAKDALDWSRKISKVGKLKLDSTRMQRTRMGLYQELGRRTYDLLKEGHFDPTEVEQLVTRIDELTVRIEEYQKEIEEASTQARNMRTR